MNKRSLQSGERLRKSEFKVHQNIERRYLSDLERIGSSGPADVLTVQWWTGPNCHIEHLLMDILNCHKGNQEKFSTLQFQNLFAVLFHFTSCSVLTS